MRRQKWGQVIEICTHTFASILMQSYNIEKVISDQQLTLIKKLGYEDSYSFRNCNCMGELYG